MVDTNEYNQVHQSLGACTLRSPSLMRDDTKFPQEDQGVQESYIANSSCFNQTFNVFASASRNSDTLSTGQKQQLLCSFRVWHLIFRTN
ncbi:hypothetical protein Sjap_008964 [Stephania japonica]|uniref:Uncharacterized protein n=1 Tax=Stephania japonica TaxID=461633 RepID=A0AAP0PF52_9MAGN